MKRLIPLVFLLFIGYSSFGQALSTLLKLNEISNALGIVSSIANDTTLTKAVNSKMQKKNAEQQMYLLRAAEYYKNKDYESSSFYINKVKDFDYIDLNNLKYVILVGSYANLKDIKNATKNFYNAIKIIDPVNIRTIRSEIRKNFKKKEFDKEFSNYSPFSSERKKIIDDINFEE